MAQLKQVCTVTNGSQTVTVIGTNVAYRIKANSIFMVQGELVPYVVAADAVFDGTNTVATLAAAYQGVGNAMASGVFATDFTVPDNLPLLSQGDVGTAAIWTNTMYKIQALMAAVSPSGLVASVDQIAANLNGAQQAQTAAAASAAAALASQNAAKTSETNSKTSENNAASSASAAATSKTNAGTSETNAAASKTAAAGSATAASTSASAASSSQGAAATSATSAANSATAAAGSATAASTSQGAALASQNAAKTSETNSKTSETNSKTSETNSKTSETNAAASATAAAGSATAAAGSATASAGSATSAASSLSQVQGILATLNALQLGSKASDPTKDNNGNALTVGSKYFNTTTQQTRVYTSTGWQDEDQTAETMAANATASAAAAAGSASAASASQTAAHTSETNAAGSASAASTSATNAGNSASAAAGSASAASTSAGNAKTSETNSKASETNAAASAAQAAQTAANIGNPVSKGGDTMTGNLVLDGAKFQSTRYALPGAILMCSASGTQPAPTALASGSQIGIATFRGYDGANYQEMAAVDAWSEDTVTSSTAPANLRFSTTPSGSVAKLERMRITAAGRVLIGTQTDDSTNMLQVGGSVRAGNYFINSQGTGDAGTFGFSNANGPGIVAFGSGTTGAGALVLRTANTERARITSAGLLLIGQTADNGSGVLVQANGDIQAANGRIMSRRFGIQGAVNLETALGTSAAPTVVNAANTVGAIVARGYDGSTFRDVGYIGMVTDGAVSSTSSPGYLVFSTTPSGSVLTTERMRVTSLGRVLIGATTDDGVGTLQVNSTLTLSGARAASFSTGNFDGLSIESFNTGNTVKKPVALAPYGGRVLLGTLTDDGSNLLQANGTIVAMAATGALRASNGSGTGQTSILLKREGGATDQKQWELLSGSDGSMGLRAVNDAYSAAAYALSVTRGTGVSLTAMQLMGNGGRVIVGNMADDGATALQVAGNKLVTGISYFGNGAGQGWANSDASSVYFYGKVNANIGTTGASGYLGLVTGNAERARLTSAGRLLIGTTVDDGSNSLQVAGPARFLGEVQSTQANTFRAVQGNYGAFVRNDGSSVYLMQTASGDQYGGYNSLRPFAWSLTSGNITIDGTGASTTFGGPVILSKSDGTAQPLAIRANAGQQRNIQFQTGTTNRWQIMTDSTAESGSNNGSDFYIQAFADNGTWAFNPFVIKRSNGRVIINNGMDVTGTLTVNRSSGEGDLLLGQNDGYFFGSTTAAGWYSPTGGTFQYNFSSKNLFVNSNAVWHVGNLASPMQTTGATMTGALTMSSASTYSPAVVFNANGYAPFIRANSAASTVEFVNSANTALNMSLTDAGYLSTRGGANFGARPTWAGATPWDSGNFNPASYLALAGGAMAGTLYVSPTAGGSGAVQSSSNIGGSFANWSSSRAYALQVDSLDPAAAYGGIRWTQWGSRHLAAIDAYAGGTTSTAPSIVMHFSNQSNAWTFSNTGIVGAVGTVIHTGNFTASALPAYTANRLRLAAGGGSDTVWNWSGQGGQPQWMWGGNDGVNMYVYNPSNFSVNYANSAGVATTATQISGNAGHTFQTTWGGAGISWWVDGTQQVYMASNVSDERLKENIQPVTQDSLGLIDQIEFKEFDFINGQHVDAGFIAQAVEAFAPGWIDQRDSGKFEDQRFTNNQAMLFAAMHAIQQLSTEVKALKNQLATH